MTVDPNAPLNELPGSPVVRAEPDSRLEQLVALFDQQDVASKKAAAELEETKAAIKTELSQRHPNSVEVLLVSGVLERPLRFYAQTSWKLNSKVLKAKEPVTWVKYAYESTAWYLARVK